MIDWVKADADALWESKNHTNIGTKGVNVDIMIWSPRPAEIASKQDDLKISQLTWSLSRICRTSSLPWTTQVYPADRGTNYAVRLGDEAARALR